MPSAGSCTAWSVAIWPDEALLPEAITAPEGLSSRTSARFSVGGSGAGAPAAPGLARMVTAWPARPKKVHSSISPVAPMAPAVVEFRAMGPPSGACVTVPPKTVPSICICRA